MRAIDSLGLKVDNHKLWILDQTLLPNQERWIEIRNPDDMIGAIKALKIRGAPLIGVGAALSLAFYSQETTLDKVRAAAEGLKNARPTAVNLAAAVDRVMDSILNESDYKSSVARVAYEVFDEDVKLCREIGDEGAQFLPDNGSVLTHCNAGGLATAGIGTAVGVIRRAFELGKKIHVYVDETRPLLQGARLTAWELEKLKIPYTLICDNMAGYLMQQKKINCIVVGADRIAKNRDFANKIGTYSLAVLAGFHKVPFYVAAPTTTVDDSCPSGSSIRIEERAAQEVRREWSPNDCEVYNPAFDVTPSHLVTKFFIK